MLSSESCGGWEADVNVWRGWLSAAPPSGKQRPERTHQTIEHRRATEPRELERQGMRASHVGLELNLMERGRQPLHPGHRVRTKGNTGFGAAHKDSFDPEQPADDAQHRLGEQRVGLRWQWPEPVAQLEPQRLDLGRLREAREPPVDVELRVLGVDVIV